jgi:hypothetical protein
MGFFADMFGKSQQRDLDAAFDESNSLLNSGYGSAKGNIRAAHDDTNFAYDSARDAMRTGNAAAQGQLNSYTNQANDILAPFAQSGVDARQLYDQAIGIQGRDAQQTFVDNFVTDPFREQNEAQATDNLIRRYNASGFGDSGASRLAAARASLERGSTDFQQRLNRLQGAASQGGQFAGQQAGITAAAGSQAAGFDFGAGQGIAGLFGNQAGTDFSIGTALAGLDVDQAATKAGNRINYGNATAENRTTGINNLLGVVTAGAKAYGAMQ